MASSSSPTDSPAEAPPARRFLITGGAGFIGSHLADRLLELGHDVALLDDLSTGSRDNIAHLLDHPSCHFARCGLGQREALDRLMAEADVVIHLAAAVGVQLIVERPAHTIQTNVFATDVVLEAALRYGCEVFLASSSEVYGKGVKVPFHEDDDVVLGASCHSRWAYSASKMVDEFLGLAYFRQHGLDVMIGRFFNTVGPRQTGRYGMVIPRFVGQALRGEPITVFGDGSQSRCFLHVADLVEAIIGLVARPASAGRVFNIGSTEEITILALAERIKQLCDSASPIVFVPYHEAYAPGFEDLRRRVPDISRIRDHLGWRPTRSLDEILRAVITFERRSTG
ncbi:MAG: NAD-dependent epimerase/dehydratase family protein [Acidobacteriota bacterium]